MIIRRPFLFALVMVFGLGSLSGVAAGQGNTPAGPTIFHPVVQAGLQDAKSRIGDDAYTGCFVTGVFVTDFAERAKLGDSGKTLGDLLEKFVCAESEPADGDRYFVSGTMTVNGETGPISSEVFRVADSDGGPASANREDWALGQFSIGDREIFRDRRYAPAPRR